ncbi:hypothetical protein B9S53_19245 [Arthrospira sp. O9.13F]|nr:hypothetical protein B9S53_19245 [Arthrospira sp. O9.13F]
MPVETERFNPSNALLRVALVVVVKNLSVCLEGEGCDHKPMPNCNGWDMPTSHGVDIETAMM